MNRAPGSLQVDAGDDLFCFDSAQHKASVQPGTSSKLRFGWVHGTSTEGFRAMVCSNSIKKIYSEQEVKIFYNFRFRISQKLT
jgi:hypothetical protein